jgi:hypothetical protein
VLSQKLAPVPRYADGPGVTFSVDVFRGGDASLRYSKLLQHHSPDPSRPSGGQILPVLLVALVLETQFFRGGRRHNLAGLLVPPIVVASFIVGEAIALHALYVGFAHRQDQVLVVGALVLGTLALLWPVFAPRAVALFRQDRSADYRLFVIAVWAALAAFVGYSLYVILFRY